ncbi:D-arabinono-1,4-lactone oxidase [Alkanindiges sp. WGS2144]|uniref:D-arabinono-1,4-lactone oxidase n=1 Tax=Alkanindiges sp. WGS2144 TaxID=3366808 RepID=UPI003751289E
MNSISTTAGSGINIQSASWQNWSGLQQSNPAQFIQPASVEELAHTVQQRQKCRVVGAGHSFSPLVCTDDTLISLDNLTGLVNHDDELCQSTLYAGTRLKDLGQFLNPINQALMNQGDIDQQSLAGAVSTGTHGTGYQLPCLSSLVEGFELVTANGDILWCDRKHNIEIFTAGRVALGSFGVLTKITMQNMPRYQLKEEVYLKPLDEILANMQDWKSQHRHIESFVFVHGEQSMVKTLDLCTDLVSPRKAPWPSEDTLLTLCSELVRALPAVNPYLQKLLGVFVKPTTCIDWSSNIFPTPRNTRFNEMEYQIPAEQGLECLNEVVHTLRKHKAPMFFPLEYRYVKADDIWLSPFYQRDSASISIHQYHKQDCQQIFKLVEPVFQKYQGRPHWGKMHNMSAPQLRALYPRWNDFMQLREQLDPQQKWLNQHLQQLFLD